MKFGKQLQGVIDSSDPEWVGHWINYKLLKKKLKELPRGSFQAGPATAVPVDAGAPLDAGAHEDRAGGLAACSSKEGGPIEQEQSEGKTVGMCCGRPGTRCDADGLGESRPSKGNPTFDATEQISALSRSPQEAAFFKLVNKELQKMTQFFCSVEAQMLGRLGHVREGMKLIDMDTVLGKDEASWRHLLAACIKLYKDLLRLENYAIVAWTSVSKILKKHDKWTGFCTRHRFMQNVVSKLPFTHYPKTVVMLEEVEGMYQRVNRIRECSQFKCSSLQDEVLFIETIRDINEVVSRIQEEEHKEAGITTPLKKKQRREQESGVSGAPVAAEQRDEAGRGGLTDQLSAATEPEPIAGQDETRQQQEEEQGVERVTGAASASLTGIGRKPSSAE